MGGGVAAKLAFVAGGGDHLALVDHHSADRHVVVFERALGLAQGKPHEVLVAREESRADGHGATILLPT